MKLDSSGSIQWVTQLGKTTKGFVDGSNLQYEACNSIAVDSSDNVYCAGATYGALGEANGGGGQDDAFVMKLDSNGALQWVTQLGETTKGFVGGDNIHSDSCRSIAVDSSDNVYCAGSTAGALGEASGGQDDAFVMKLDSSGAIQWITQLGETTKGFVGGDNSQSDNSQNDFCNSIAVDSSDNVYCAGSTAGALGEASGGQDDAFVMKLDSSGAIQWITQLGETTKGFVGEDNSQSDNSQSDSCHSIAVDNSDNVYCAGSTSGALGEAHGGQDDAFVMKLDSSGAIQWVTQLGETTKGFVDGDNSQNDYCYSIAVDSSDNVYCAGSTYGALGEAQGGEGDVFVMKLTPP